ncbi:MAG: hypothetical protein KDD65_15270 [Bacteroidetes bacterium]|nr:hypothetical protein [Bacteroidota bacterium]
MNPYDLDTEVVEAIAAVMRSRLIRGQSVTIPGVGSLKVVHSPSTVVPTDNGSSLTPPCDYVVFQAVKTSLAA